MTDPPGPRLRAGAAAVSIRPESPQPMIGFVRRQERASGEGLPLEATALVLADADTRVVLCGVDVIGLPIEMADRLRDRIAAAVGGDPAGVVLNCNHTHDAPPPARSLLDRSGLLATFGDESLDQYERLLEARLVEVCARAAGALEPAAVAWGTGTADISVSRRERDDSGRIVHGWNPDGLLDQQVIALQAQRPDESPVATVIGFGCHPVAVGMDVPFYSADYPGAAREAVRARLGGEAVFLQGAAGNVLPRVSFCGDEREAVRMGNRLALEAAHALADRPAWATRYVREGDASLIPMSLFRRKLEQPEAPALAAAEERVRFPLGPVPTEAELEELVTEYEGELAAAEDRGAGKAETCGIAYHAKWAQNTLAAVRDGTAETEIEAPMQALRIGEGAVVTVPGELFTEIGWAIKERSPAVPTVVSAYSNGTVGYFPTPEAYSEGGYEPAYSNRSYGTPATPAPSCAELIARTAVRLLERLFPERPAFEGDDWTPAGPLPTLAPIAPERPPEHDYSTPATVTPPG